MSYIQHIPAENRRTALQVAHSHIADRKEPLNLTRPGGKSFEEFAAALQSCRVKGLGLNRTRLKEVMHGAIADSDFGESYDLAIDQPGAFWDKIIREDQGLANVRAVPTSAHIISSNELTLGANGEDIVRPGVEGTDPGTTVTTDTAQRTFVPEEAIAIVGITDSVLEDNIEHGTLEAHLQRMILDTFTNEISKAIWNGTKVGTSNGATQRKSITGMFDGFIQQFNGGGNIVYATAVGGGDRTVSSVVEDNPFLAAAKLLPSKYGGSGFTWITQRGIIMDWLAELADRPTSGGDQWIQGGYMQGATPQGFPMFFNPSLRSNYIVKGTGVVQSSSPVDTDLDGIAVSRQAAVTVTTVTNEANANKYVIDDTAAGLSFNLNAEYGVQSGSAAGSVITLASNLVRDHADAEKFLEYSTAPDRDGTPCLLTDWGNLEVHYQRQMRIEPYRLPFTRATYFILTMRLVPIVLNPDRGVLIRDLLVR